MKHRAWWCAIIYTHGCPVCMVRRLLRGFRMNPVGYREELMEIRKGRLFSRDEKRWILEQVGQW